MLKNIKFISALFVLCASFFPLASFAAEGSAAQSAGIKRVVFLGENDMKEVDIQALREAADLIQGSRPELSEEIRKAADIVAS